MDKQISVITKNSVDEIRIAFSEFKGRTYLDVRIFTEIENGKEKIPTKRGISINPALLPDLLTALTQAEAEARQAGLVG